MRYENKFVYNKSNYYEVLSKIFDSQFFFNEIYHERRINNIYLDTAMLSNYYDNIIGAQNREKHRIRWYGENAYIKHPILEYKIKNGELGYKNYFNLPSFVFDNCYNYNNYLDIIKRNIDAKDHKYCLMYNEIKGEIPSLYNSYKRRYFLSGNDKYRITIDTDLTFASIKHSLKSCQIILDNIVVELKYEKEDIEGATQIMQDLGFRVSRNSKYVTGINQIYYNNSMQ